jgi:ABC-type bacteriocin/lantibiotic exporter with double-glycine peptidase domain
MSPNPLALTIAESIVARTGMVGSMGGWRQDLRRLDLTAADAASLADRVSECTRRAGLSFLRRTFNAPEWRTALSGAAAPLVVLADTAAGETRAAVIERVTHTTITLRLSSGASLGAPEELALDAAFTRIAGGSAFVAVLFPTQRIESGTGADDEVPDEPATPMQRLGALLLVERGNIGLVYAYATLVGLFSLTLPLGVQAIIGLVSGGLLLQPVVLLILFVVAGTLATGVLQVLQLAAVESIQQRIFARIALEFSIRVPRISVERAWREDLPERMNRFFEVVTIQKSLGKLLTGTTTALLQVIFGLLLLTFYHPYFTLFGIGLTVTLAVILRVTGPRGLETSLMESAYKYRTVHWLEEMARAVHTFKASGRSSLALERMDGHVSGYLRYRRRHFRVLVTQALAAIGFKTIVTGALLVLGSALVIDRQITLGQFVAAELVIVTVLAGIGKLVESLADVYDMLTAVYKLGGVTDLPLDRSEGLVLAADGTGARVKVGGLAYRYASGTQFALRDVAFEAAPGERFAITGPDGSGQSTLLHVIAGLLPSYDGNIQVDGITLRDLEPAALRDRMGLVLEHTELFEGTVEENISLGRAGIGPAEVMEALGRVGAADAVQSMEHGLSTMISSGARGLPSALRVRLLVARAIVGRPRLLLVDEVLALVEPVARHQLIAALTDPGAPWTLLVVTHAREMLEACDRVLVLLDGAPHALGPWKGLTGDPVISALLPTARGAA